MAPGSNTLTFTIDSLNIGESFTGSSREESAEQFYDFLLSEGGDILSRI